MNIFILLIMLSSSSALAVTSLEQTVILNAKIVDYANVSEPLSTTIVGPSFQPVIYDKTNKKFEPIFYRLISKASKTIDRFSFNVHHKSMICSASQTNKTSIIPLELSIEPNGVKEVNGKITLSGPSYWSYFDFNGAKKYISDLNFKVTFPTVNQLQHESMYCTGYIILLSTVDV